MDANFPKRQKDLNRTGNLLNQMNELGVTLKDLSDGWEKIKPFFSKIEYDNFQSNGVYNNYVQVGIARIALDLTNEKFRKRFLTKFHQDRIQKLINEILPLTAVTPNRCVCANPNVLFPNFAFS